jgi:hypothetical protein
MDNPELRKKLQYLREQRSRTKKKLKELQMTTAETCIDEELRLFNYWKNELETCKAKFEKVVRDHKIVEAHYQNRFDSATANLESAKKGVSKPIKIQQIRLDDIDNEIDECEAILEGRKSKGLLQAEAMVEEIQIKKLIQQHKYTPPTTPKTAPVIKKQPKQVKKLNEISQTSVDVQPCPEREDTQAPT